MSNLVEKKSKSEILAEEIGKLDYGDIIPHATISNIIHEQYGTSKYNSIVQQAKKLLLDGYGYVLKSKRADGYWIIPPNRHTDVALDGYRSGLHAIERSRKVLEHTPVNKLTPEERDVHRRVYDRAVILDASMKGAVLEIRTLAQPKKNPLLAAVRT